MNPLELSGPEFLLFYGVFATAVIVALWWLNRELGNDAEPGELDLANPYEIAHLRGGRDEVVRVALVKLVQSKVLRVVDGKTVVVDDPIAARSLQEPVERELGKLFSSPMEPHKAYAQVPVRIAADRYEKRLSDKGLLLNEPMKQTRNRRTLVATIALILVGGVKVVIGIGRGRPVAFLIIMAVLAAITALVIGIRKRRTVDGDGAVEGVKQVFAHQRETSIDATAAQMAMVAAVFGLSAIPLEAFPDRKELFPHSDSSGGGSSCGSSCGGGGCGGGGCGGCGS